MKSQALPNAWKNGVLIRIPFPAWNLYLGKPGSLYAPTFKNSALNMQTWAISYIIAMEKSFFFNSPKQTLLVTFRVICEARWEWEKDLKITVMRGSSIP